MRLKHSRLSGPRKPWSYPTISLTWLLTAFFLTCHASQYLLTQSVPKADNTWLALSPVGIHEGFYWQFITHVLTAPSLWQLLASVSLFFIFGNELETLLGPRRLAGAFLFTLLPASAASLIWPPFGGQMSIWPGVCGLLAVLGTMLPMLEFRYRFFRLSVLIRLRLLAFIVPSGLAFAILTGWITHTSLLSLPSALILGYVYARWIGYGVPTRLERYFYERRLQRQRWDRLAPRQFIEQEVDPILEKIASTGWKSLTRQEKKILQRSTDTLNNS